ncbi:MAG: ROK family protein [Myxococcota bacterium]|nr:ROK family protein [Myxococcota bacterium]
MKRRGIRPVLLGIDLGGTKVAYTLADESGQILARKRAPSPNTGGWEGDIARMLESARAFCLEQGCEGPSLVGVCAPGPLDLDEGLVLHPPNLRGWTEVALPARLEEELRCPVRMENDANAGALAEWRFGAGRGARSLVYLTMSTGVGAGLILDGRLYGGPRGTAGEVGHVAVAWPGEPCACGLSGCLEAYVGGRAWSARLRQETPDSSLVLAYAGERKSVSPEHVLAAARAGDDWAHEEVSRFNHYLARGLAPLVSLLAPERIVLGTIVAAAGEELCLAPLREEVARHVWPHQAPEMEIRAAELGEDLPHRSAIAVALEGAQRA